MNGGLSVSVPHHCRYNALFLQRLGIWAVCRGSMETWHFLLKFPVNLKTTIKVISSRSRDIHALEAPIPNQMRGILERALGREK